MMIGVQRLDVNMNAIPGNVIYGQSLNFRLTFTTVNGNKQCQE